MKKPDNIELLLFDLGGVLIKFTGSRKMLEWTNGKMTEKELITWYLNSPAVMGFETGKLGSKDFARQVISELNLPVKKNQFLEELSTWFLGPYPGAKELLMQLAGSFKLATLSNTNELFWKIFKTTDIFELFYVHFPSFKVGMLKPDQRIFQQVIDSTGLRAEQILFFDDFSPNVKAALKFGIQAYQVIGCQNLKSRLEKLGIV